MASPDRNAIIVWSSDWSESTGQAIVTRRVVEGQASVEWVHASYGRGGWRSVLGLFGAMGKTYRALLNGRARSIYLVCSRSGAGFLRDVPALITSLAGMRVVIHVHGSDLVNLMFSSPLAPLARALYSRCETIVPSEHLVVLLHERYRGTVHFCENFVPRDATDDVTAVVRDAGPLVVWNSNVMASKGFFDVVEAVRLARAQQPDLRLVALGRPLTDDEMTAEAVQTALDALCGEDWFTYLGSVSPEVAFRCTAKADVVILPSRYPSECQPLAVVQAMCLGRPLVVRDTPALRATLGDYPGILLPDPSIADLAQTILEVLQAKPKSGLADAAIRARARFSPERFDRQMTAILVGNLEEAGNTSLG